MADKNRKNSLKEMNTQLFNPSGVQSEAESL